MHRTPLAVVAAVVLAVAGCAGDTPADSTAPTTSRALSEPTGPGVVDEPESSDVAAAIPADQVASQLQDWAARNDVVGAVTLVARGDTPISAAVGARSVGRDEPIELDDRFAIGSVSKPFTAIVVLRLVEDGVLELDDPVSDYLPGVPAGTTIEDLLGHTSGFLDPDIESANVAAVLDPTQRRTTAEQIAEIVAAGPAFAAGVRQQYASVNYLLLDAVIATATGSSFEAEVERLLLAPLDLQATSVVGPAGGPSPHERPGPGQPAIDLAPFDPGEIVRASGAAGALWSAATDLLTFGRALFGGEILSPASLARMLDDGAPRDDYGLGLSVYTSSTGTAYGHNGRTIGFAASLRHDVEHDLTVVVLSNDGSAPTALLAASLVELGRTEFAPGPG